MVLDGVTVSSETRHNFFLACRHELVANPSRKGSQLQTVAQSIRVKSCRSYIGFNGYCFPEHLPSPALNRGLFGQGRSLRSLGSAADSSNDYSV